VFNRYIEDTSQAEVLQILPAEEIRIVADMFQQLRDKIQVSHQSCQNTFDQDPMQVSLYPMSM
jgi:hypothetical protein